MLPLSPRCCHSRAMRISQLIFIQIVSLITLTQTSDLDASGSGSALTTGSTETATGYSEQTLKHYNLNITSTKIIDLSKLNLTTLYLSDKLIKNSKSDIEVINLSHNLINQTFNNNFVKFPNLKHLDLSNNLIDAITIDSHKLIYLNLSNNLLSQFSFNWCEHVQVLDLSCNQLGESDGDPGSVVESNQTKEEGAEDHSALAQLSKLKSLKQLDLSCNHITHLDRQLFRQLGNVTILNLSFNYLQQIQDYLFDYLGNLEILNLSNNNISDIGLFGFSNLEHLQYLDLSNNQLHVTSVRSLQGIPDLIGLSVAHNYDLRDSLQGFVASWSLNELDISSTGLCEIPSALAQSVKLLKLTDNNLGIIRCGDLDSYPLLHELILSSNSLYSIEDDAIGRLEILKVLYLDHNLLKNLPISLPGNLLKLFLNNNLLTDINVRQLEQLYNLELLDLSGNQLSYIAALPLPKLQVLNLRSTSLLSLSQSLVRTSPILRDLYLENNPIKCADLLGIAEWATPCREEKLFDGDNGEVDDEGDSSEVAAGNGVNSNYYHQFLMQNHFAKCRHLRRSMVKRPAGIKCTNNNMKLNNGLESKENDRNNSETQSNLMKLFDQHQSNKVPNEATRLMTTTAVVPPQEAKYSILPKAIRANDNDAKIEIHTATTSIPPTDRSITNAATTITSSTTTTTIPTDSPRSHEPEKPMTSSQSDFTTATITHNQDTTPHPSTAAHPLAGKGAVSPPPQLHLENHNIAKPLNLNQRKYLTQNATTTKYYHKKKNVATTDKKSLMKTLKMRKETNDDVLSHEIPAVPMTPQGPKHSITSGTPAKRSDGAIKEIANISIKSFSTHRTTAPKDGSVATDKGKSRMNATAAHHAAPKRVTHINHNNFETKLDMMNEKDFMIMNSVNSNPANGGSHSTGGGSTRIENNNSTSGSSNLVKYEKLNDLRSEQKHINHPGLFMVIGVTIGIIITLGLIHLYRCRKPYAGHHQHPDCNNLTTPSHSAHSDALRLEVLNPSQHPLQQQLELQQLHRQQHRSLFYHPPPSTSPTNITIERW